MCIYGLPREKVSSKRSLNLHFTRQIRNSCSGDGTMFSERSVSRTLATVGALTFGLLSLGACDNREAAQLGPAQSARTATPEAGKIPEQPSTKAVEIVPPGPMPHYNIHFSVASAQLSPDAAETLLSAAEYLRAYPAVQVKLSGYTDLLGSADTNKKLAEQRVASATQYLEESGIDRSRIVTDAVGEADATHVPSGENATTWNRRVEVEFSLSPSS